MSAVSASIAPKKSTANVSNQCKFPLAEVRGFAVGRYGKFFLLLPDELPKLAVRLTGTVRAEEMGATHA